MKTNATIEVVERRCWRHPVTGHTVSIHGAAPQPSEGYEVVVDGYTWRVTSHRGSITYGLGRTVAKTREEADAAAARFAKRTGYRVIPTGVTVSEVRAVFDAAIAGETDPDRIARVETLREYFCNPEFRAALADHAWANR